MENVSGGDSEADWDGINERKRKAANLVGGRLASGSLLRGGRRRGRGGAARLRTGSGREGGSESELGRILQCG
jgi:hypothetical protein